MHLQHLSIVGVHGRCRLLTIRWSFCSLSPYPIKNATGYWYVTLISSLLFPTDIEGRRVNGSLNCKQSAALFDTLLLVPILMMTPRCLLPFRSCTYIALLSRRATNGNLHNTQTHCYKNGNALRIGFAVQGNRSLVRRFRETAWNLNVFWVFSAMQDC